MSLYSVRKPVAQENVPDRIDALQSDWAAERPELDTSGMAVVGRIMVLSGALERRVSDVLKPHDLNYSDFDALATLARAGAPYELTPTDLMNAVVLSSGAMTALLDRLVQRGLIARGQSKRDGRVRTAVLTKKGKALVDEVVKARFAEANDAVSCLSKKEQDTLAAMLRRMGGWLDQQHQD
ncbi:MAG: MarR family transcriptional regulator [Pseudomonadota bacterium]